MLTEIARAKLNLALHVRARRPDGYHELETLFAFVEFGDVLRIVPADPPPMRPRPCARWRSCAAWRSTIPGSSRSPTP